jgi:hypothetical protein
MKKISIEYYLARAKEKFTKYKGVDFMQIKEEVFTEGEIKIAKKMQKILAKSGNLKKGQPIGLKFFINSAGIPYAQKSGEELPVSNFALIYRSRQNTIAFSNINAKHYVYKTHSLGEQKEFYLAIKPKKSGEFKMYLMMEKDSVKRVIQDESSDVQLTLFLEDKNFSIIIDIMPMGEKNEMSVMFAKGESGMGSFRKHMKLYIKEIKACFEVDKIEYPPLIRGVNHTASGVEISLEDFLV